jgi:hypothetical protein
MNSLNIDEGRFVALGLEPTGVGSGSAVPVRFLDQQTLDRPSTPDGVGRD